MKKIFYLFLFISSISFAQFSVNGTMTKTLESDWVILYKIENTKQLFIANTKIKTDSLLIDGKQITIGKFSFKLPKNSKTGSYRATYKLDGAGFVDFIFNKENINFTFNPDYPEETMLFSDSKENIIYQNYLAEITLKQQELDAIQIAVLKDQTLHLDADYKKALSSVINTQNEYLENTKELYVHPFIKASLRSNPLEIMKTPKEYMSNLTTTFFDNIDFSDETLINSSFLTNRIVDYLFYINYSDDAKTQNLLFKKAIDLILAKTSKITYKKQLIVFMIAEFEKRKNIEPIDYLLENHYNKLPNEIKDAQYLLEKNKLFATEIGRIAPDFSWTKNGKKIKLSTLTGAENYILIFWSTDCSHCLREIPQLHAFLETKKNIKVIAYAMEKNDFNWKNMKDTLPNWYHVLGLNKWENKVARTYNINSTPTYLVLDSNKKIIGKPDELTDVKTFVEQL